MIKIVELSVGTLCSTYSYCLFLLAVVGLLKTKKLMA